MSNNDVAVSVAELNGTVVEPALVAADDGAPSNVAATYAGYRRPWYKKLWSNFKHMFPTLVWAGDELNVVVTFENDKLVFARENQLGEPLPAEEIHKLRTEAEKVIKNSPLEEAEAHIRRAGIQFDTGIGATGRDWFFDYSLRGPVSVKFISKVKGNSR